MSIPESAVDGKGGGDLYAINVEEHVMNCVKSWSDLKFPTAGLESLAKSSRDLPIRFRCLQKLDSGLPESSMKSKKVLMIPGQGMACIRLL